MFNKTYGAGYRAGMATPWFRYIGNLKYIATPQCPFSSWRLISCALWHSGLHDGMVKRLSQRLPK